MTDKLPPNLLALFAPRPPLRWVAPCDLPAEDRKTTAVGGVAEFLPALAAYKDADGFVPTESWLEARDRKKLEKKAEIEKLLTEGPLDYKPQEDQNIRGDAFKTMIVSRLSYDATEEDLEKEFGRVGPIERIRIVKDTHAHEKGNKKKKPHRGYAFIVFEREKDMRVALEQLDGISIKGRRIKTDVERGRTVKGWKPRRLGGGLGGRGYTKVMPPRPAGPGGFGGRGGFGGGRGGGFRDRGGGGFRGGFDRGGGRGGFGGPRGDFGAPRGDRGFGGPSNGYGGPPNAPSGPGGFGGRPPRDFGGGGGYDRRGGGGSYDDRSGGGYRGGGGGGFDRSTSGSNAEPLGSRPSGGYRDRGSDRGGDRGGDRGDYGRRDDDSRKRPYEGGSGYEEQRKLRRY